MDAPLETENLHLLDYVKSLENRDRASRRQQLLASLKSLGIEPEIQSCRLLKIRNIIVDFPSGFKGRRPLFSAHYDAVRGSPGANDNASGVAVLLGLCRILKARPVPARIIFFDREEAWLRTPFLKLGLLGSLYYVFTHRLKDFPAIFNLEFCGQGDVLCVWPVKKAQKGLPAVKAAEKAASDLKVDLKLAHIPWLLLSSDHLSFRLRGRSNAITLTLLPDSQVPVLEKMIAGLSVKGLLAHKRPSLPAPLATVHTDRDESSQLSEDSLHLMLSVLRKIMEKTASSNADNSHRP
jgi:aminopeptidase YwaD